MKKYAFPITLTILCLTLTGCGSKTPEVSSQAFGVEPASSQEISTDETSASETQPISSEANPAEELSSIEENQPETSSIFEVLPKSFYFSSGVGAWATELQIAPDGSFTGEYHDSDMGDNGDEYPNGTVYICRFNGKFSTPQLVDEFSFSMQLESLELDGTPGDISYEDGVRYIYSEPYGLYNAEEVLLYLPGRQLSRTSEAFVSWSHIDMTVWDIIPPGWYGLYNVNAETAFIGIADETP